MSTRSDVAVVPKPIDVGPEMEALERFFRPCTWEGTIHEGGMGPGTPAMRGVGRGAVEPIQGGRWIAGDFEQDQFLEDGTFVLRWQLHWVSGWDPEHGERLVFESMDDTGPRLRFTSDALDPTVVTWRNEMALEGGAWFLIEEYPMVPA